MGTPSGYAPSTYLTESISPTACGIAYRVFPGCAFSTSLSNGNLQVSNGLQGNFSLTFRFHNKRTAKA